LFELVELLSEIKGANKNLVPATALMRECGETFRSDPFEELDV